MRLKQRIVRILIHEIVVDVDDESRAIVLMTHWQGGHHTEVRVPKPSSGRTKRCTDAEAIALVRRMAGRWRDDAIAAPLNLLGWRTGTGNHWTRMRVRELRSRLDLPAADPTQSAWLTATAAAKHLGISPAYAGLLLKRGIIPGTQAVPGSMVVGRSRDPRIEGRALAAVWSLRLIASSEGPSLISLAASHLLMRTRVQNALQAIALGSGVRRGPALWSRDGQAVLASLPLPPHAAHRRSELQALYQHLDEQADQLDDRVKSAAAQRARATLLMTHPGVGPVTALATDVFLGDPSRFPDGKALANYIGMIPSEYSSGPRQRLGALTKQGNPLLRFLWCEAALHAAIPSCSAFTGASSVKKGWAKPESPQRVNSGSGCGS